MFKNTLLGESRQMFCKLDIMYKLGMVGFENNQKEKECLKALYM